MKAVPWCLLMGISSVSASCVLTPVYPAPGGTTFSGSGSSALGARHTHFYTGFDETQYADLVWSFTSIQNPWHSSQGGPTGNMTFSSYNLPPASPHGRPRQRVLTDGSPARAPRHLSSREP